MMKDNIMWKSTVAAAKYLNILYEYFGDWLLVVAAYNSGPGPVLKCDKKIRKQEFLEASIFLTKRNQVRM